MTEEEYIRFESGTEVPHEYINGFVRQVPEKCSLHGATKTNLIYHLLKKLKAKDYWVLSSVIKLRIPGQPVYLYPDVFVSNEFVPDIHVEHIFSSAIFIATIYTEGATAFDTIDKFMYCRQMQELQYYLLIVPAKKIVQFFSRTKSNEWQYKYFTLPDEKINLPAINLSISLQDLFE